MADSETKAGSPPAVSWRLLSWGGAAALLLFPLITGAPWTLSDYVVMGVLFALVGLVLELAVRASSDWTYRAAAGSAAVTAFLLIWVNGAVGFLGSENNPANLVFLGVIGIALLGSLATRARPAGMAYTMFAAAGSQLLVGIIAIPMGWASPGNQGVFEVVMGTTLFTGLWLLSAALFRSAAMKSPALRR